MSKRTQRETLEKIVHDYEAAPAKGNSTDEMIARTEYMLAKRMLGRVIEVNEAISWHQPSGRC